MVKFRLQPSIKPYLAMVYLDKKQHASKQNQKQNFMPWETRIVQRKLRYNKLLLSINLSGQDIYFEYCI